MTTPAAAPAFTSLVPATGPVDAEMLLDGLERNAALPGLGGQRQGRVSERPYTVANFISSADGRATFDGRSGPLGDPGDRAIFQGLRERVDAILAGTTTLAVERYGRLISDAERRGRRLAAGRPAEPLAVAISRRGDFPLDAPLFAEPEARVVLFAPVAPSLAGVAASVMFEPLTPGSDVQLGEALTTLRRRHDVRLLLCEGGPTLFGALLGAGLVDELFLTLAPRLAGGVSGPAITAGPPLAELAPLRLVRVLQRGDALYLRYAVNS